MVSTRALRAAIRGALTGELAPAGRLIAYHGTPHTLAPEPGAPLGRFRLDKVGTGEGMQAYGWGVPYLAESADVGREYQRMLAHKAYASGTPESVAVSIMDSFSPTTSRLTLAQRALESAPRGRGRENWIEASKLLADDSWQPSKGRLYEVDIPEGPYLDWDAPLREQGEILETLNSLYKPAIEAKGDVWPEQGVFGPSPYMVGSDAYQLLSSRGGLGSAKSASLGLGNKGIPGIRYLDAGSRGAGEGTRNYVMFDPDLAHIRAVKAALLAALVGGGALGAEEINA